MYNRATSVVLLWWTKTCVHAAFCHPSLQWTITRNHVEARTPKLPSGVLFSKYNNDKNQSPDDKDNDDLPFLTIAIPLVSLLAVWPLLALLRDTNDPTTGFDIDMFMALKDILDTTSESNLPDDILELPLLSPAERLVDAIFGPPF